MHSEFRLWKSGVLRVVALIREGISRNLIADCKINLCLSAGLIHREVFGG